MTRYGVCSVCGGTYSVRKGGLMRIHGYRAYPNGGAECPGSGRSGGAGMSPQRRQIIEAAGAKGFTVTRLEWSPIGQMVEMSGREGGWWVEGQRGDLFEMALGYNAGEVVDWINEWWPDPEGQA